MRAIESISQITSQISILYRMNPRFLLIMAGALSIKLALSQFLTQIETRLENMLAIGEEPQRTKWHELFGPKAIRAVRSLAQEPTELASFIRTVKNQDRNSEREGLIWRVFSPIQDLLDNVLEMAGLWIGGKLVISGSLSTGDLTIFILMATSTFEQIRMLCARHLSLSDGVFLPITQMLDC